jgi:PAS domain S-box-containing protein
MEDSDKTREELIKELLDLHHSNNALRKQYEADIDLLKLAETKAGKSEEKFRKVYMTSPDAVNINRLSDGMFVSVNEGFTKILGYTGEETLGKTSLELNIWADTENRNQLVRELKEKSKIENFEAIFLKKDGSKVNGLMSASLIDIDGVPHILNVTKDISIRKRVEEALAHEQYLMNAIMNNFPDHIYFKDKESCFIRINKSMTRFLGLSDPDQALGKSDSDFFTGEHAKQAYEDEQNIIQTGQFLNIEEKETHHNRPDTWVSTIKLPLHDQEGNIVGTFGISRDITGRKRKEMESHALYEISEGITTTDNLDELLKLIHQALGKVVYAENCFVALYDNNTGLFSFPYFVDKFDPVPLPTSMGKSCSAYVFRTRKPLLLTQKIFDQLLEQNEVELVGSNSPSWIGIPLQTPSNVIGVLVLQHYEKENVYSESDVRFLVSIGSQIALSIERKKSEDEIKLKNEMLQATNAEKDKFFSIIAHDLRGPLSAFVDATQIITEDIQNMTLDEIRDITMSMKTDASNIYKLLENLLEWSRLQRGVMEFNPQKLKLSNIIGKGVASVTASARTKGIDINIIIPDDVEITVDEHMFETVVRNLVSNAVKFTPDGGKIKVSATVIPENYIEIRITDSGIGMTLELRDKLFKMNERTNRTGTAGEPSSGLGLLLCKEFIEKHRGRIWVESEEGKGSTFTFTIPLKV